MTNDVRHRLEDAIISYGAAKALHAATDVEFREMALEACAEAWDRIEQCLDTLEVKAEPRKCEYCNGTGIDGRMGADNMDIIEFDCSECGGTGTIHA